MSDIPGDANDMLLVHGADEIEAVPLEPFNFEVDQAEPEELDRQLCRLVRNDDGNGQRLIARHGRDLIFVREVGWHVWTGSFWDSIGGESRAYRKAFDAARRIHSEAALYAEEVPQYDGETVKQFAERLAKPYRWAVASGNIAKINAMLNAAQQYVERDRDEMDRDKYRLCTLNGTLQLGRPTDDGYVPVDLVDHRRDDLITRQAPVVYDADAQAPGWLEFLSLALPDAEVRAFVQRFLGSALTGDASDQAIACFTGTGGNGKSTLLEAVAGALGPYAMTLPFESLQRDDRKQGGQATPDIARLPGCRLVEAAEPEVGVQLSMAQIKRMSGGQRMSCRHLNHGFFDFVPEFKVVLSFNDKPKIRDTTEGAWRRLFVVNFPTEFHKLPGRVSQVELLDRFKAEAPGILNWLLDGYRAWRERGLAPPDVVLAETEQYRAEQDPVGQFLLACCDLSDETARTNAADLYKAYQTWCTENALDSMTQTGFGRALGGRSGITKERLASRRLWRGINLNVEYRPDQGPIDDDLR